MEPNSLITVNMIADPTVSPHPHSMDYFFPQDHSGGVNQHISQPLCHQWAHWLLLTGAELGGVGLFSALLDKQCNTYGTYWVQLEQ